MLNRSLVASSQSTSHAVKSLGKRSHPYSPSVAFLLKLTPQT